MKKLSEIEINYMGVNCTVEDFVKYSDSPKKCPELSKIGTIVYLNKGVNDIQIDDECIGLDSLMDYLSNDSAKALFVILFAVKHFNIKELPDIIFDIMGNDDEDFLYDATREILKELKL